MPTTPLTPQQIEAFTDGDCWVLARELHALGAGELAFIAAEPPIGPFEAIMWSHAVIRRADGTFLDARGVSTEEELRETWGWVGSPDELHIAVAPSLEAYEAAVADQFRYYRHSAKIAARKLAETFPAA